MDIKGALAYDSRISDKTEYYRGKIIDGHAPGLRGKRLNAYISLGIMTDHESVSYEEAVEKLSKGLAVLVREGSACHNLKPLLEPIIKNGIDTDRMAFCTDDKHLSDIVAQGTIANCVREAIRLGMNPAQAYKMASYNGFRIYGFRDKGAVAPGFAADLVILGSLGQVKIDAVIKDGIIAVEDGRYVGPEYKKLKVPAPLLDSVNFRDLTSDDLRLEERDVYDVIGIMPRQVTTEHLRIKVPLAMDMLKNGKLCKIAVAERYKSSGSIGVGLIRGYGLRGGAFASTVAHDSHNLMLVGDSDQDMLLASRRIKAMHGGLCVVSDRRVIAELPLEIGGLMSRLGADQLIAKLNEVISALRSLHVCSDIDPVMTVSFMALTVIPKLRITDRGIFDVETGQPIRQSS